MGPAPQSDTLYLFVLSRAFCPKTGSHFWETRFSITVAFLILDGRVGLRLDGLVARATMR